MIDNSEFTKRVIEASKNQQMVEIPQYMLDYVAGGPDCHGGDPSCPGFDQFADLAGGPGSGGPTNPPGEYPQPDPFASW